MFGKVALPPKTMIKGDQLYCNDIIIAIATRDKTRLLCYLMAGFFTSLQMVLVVINGTLHLNRAIVDTIDRALQALLTCQESDQNERLDGCQRMMVQVQPRDLRLLLA